MRVAEVQVENAARRLMLAGMVIMTALTFAVAAKICLETGLGWACPLISMTGIPCPSCGSTRAFAALAEMDLLSALKFNPLIIAGLFALPLLGLSERVPVALKRHGWTIFGTVVFLNWLYLFLFLPR